MPVHLDTLAIDPGTERTGFAGFGAGGLLVFAWSVQGPGTDPRTWPIWDGLPFCSRDLLVGTLCIEGQQIYPGAPRPQDIVTLAQWAGFLAGKVCCADTRLLRPLPSAWKGHEKKEQTRRRLRGLLSPFELDRVSDDCPDTWDAIGLGFFALGR